jgi:hypothetical protein
MQACSALACPLICAPRRARARHPVCVLDIKSWDPATYRRVTGGDIAPTLRFARRLADFGKPVWIRYVVVPGWTDEVANVDGVAQFAGALGNVERVDVLPFHHMDLEKYQELGIDYPIADVRPPSAALIDRIREQFQRRTDRRVRRRDGRPPLAAVDPPDARYTTSTDTTPLRRSRSMLTVRARKI